MMMFKVVFTAGSNIEQACTEAVTYANRMNINVVFDFNGITVCVKQGAVVSVLVANYECECKNQLLQEIKDEENENEWKEDY